MKRVILIIILMFPLFVFAKEEVKFDKCIDGDTFKAKINDEIITVRLLAVDTPEIKHDKVEYDLKSDKFDKYGRTLAWVYVDNYLLNDILVRNGYGEVAYVYDNYKYVDLLKEHESLAKIEKLGIWNDNIDDDVDNILIWSSIFTAILLSLFAILKNKLKNIFK